MQKYLEDWWDWFRYDVRTWSEGQRNFWPRALFALIGIPSFIKILFHLKFWTPWTPFVFVIHELGHVFFMFFGEFIAIAGGTLLQHLVPAIYLFIYFRKRDYFGAAFCFLWLGESFYDSSFYIADARLQALPLVSPFGGGGTIIHDWNYLLGHLGLLEWDTFLGAVSRWMGFVFVCIFLYWNYEMLKIMFSYRNEDSLPEIQKKSEYEEL